MTTFGRFRRVTTAWRGVVVLVVAAACAPASAPPPGATITGSPVVGTTLQARAGNWSNGPTHFQYAWSRCTDAAATTCVAAGAGPSYALTAADVGTWMRVTVTGINQFGSGTALSAPVGPVVDTAVPTVDAGSDEPLPAPKAGAPYAVQLTNGGPPGQVWSVTDGAFPEGLTLSPSGLLSGTPTGPGQLWAADVAVSAPAARAGVAAVSAGLHLWGWTYGPQTHVDFPGTVLWNPDADVLVQKTLVSGEPPHYWTVHPDGTVTEPQVTDLFGSYAIPDQVPAPYIPFGLAGLGSGRWVAAAQPPPNPHPCDINLWDITHGPIGVDPGSTITIPAVIDRPICAIVPGEKTVWRISSVDTGSDALVQAFNRADGTLLRETVTNARGTAGIMVEPDGSRLSLLEAGSATVPSSLSTFGLTQADDRSVVTDRVYSPLLGGQCSLGFFAKAPAAGVPKVPFQCTTATNIDVGVLDLTSGTSTITLSQPNLPTSIRTISAGATVTASGQVLATDGTSSDNLYLVGGSVGANPTPFLTGVGSAIVMFDR